LSDGINQEHQEITLPLIDFSSKFSLVKSQEARRKFIFDILCDIAKETVKVNSKKETQVSRGLLIVYGKFDRNENKVYGMMQLHKSSSDDSVMWIQDKKFKDFLIEKSEHSDGAIVINHDGLVLGTDIWLFVTDPFFSLEEECATRHLSAMSFSKRDDVIAIYALSEETSKVRMYVDGKRAELYDPSNTNSTNVM